MFVLQMRQQLERKEVYILHDLGLNESMAMICKNTFCV